MTNTSDLGRLELLRMARIGLQIRLEQVETEIIGVGLKAPNAPKIPKKRTMSAAGRKAIGDASRKRWAMLRKQKAQGNKKVRK